MEMHVLLLYSEFRPELARLASIFLDVLLACKETPRSPTDSYKNNREWN